MSVVIVGVGSNLGAREASIRSACDLLNARNGIEVRQVSAIYETAPLGPPQPEYLNAAFRLETALSAPALLRILLRTERRLGRKRGTGPRWGPRSIDLDLLWDERGPFASSELQVPHPELGNRPFALAPLLDVVPELRSTLGSSLARLGGPPPKWTREASVHARATTDALEVEVEADSAIDACALCVESERPTARPWSTRHLVLEPGPEPFAAALRDLLRSGFHTRRATISDSSKSRWIAQFHGASAGTRLDADVRLWTTSGSKRKVLARLWVAWRPGLM